MHPRMSVNAICLPLGIPPIDYITSWTDAGLERIGIPSWKLENSDWEEAVRGIQDSPLEVSTISHRSAFELDNQSSWDQSRNAVLRTIKTASALESPTVYITTGPAGVLTWEEALAALQLAVRPLIEVAKEHDIRLLFETTNSLRTDIGFVHTIRDAIDVSRTTGLGLCVDLGACWPERSLRSILREAADMIGLVQVCDLPASTNATRDRVVPGDGVIPITTIIGWLLEDGYDGCFDLEILGPRIEEEGPLNAVVRGAEHLGGILGELGA